MSFKGWLNRAESNPKESQLKNSRNSPDYTSPERQTKREQNQNPLRPNLNLNSRIALLRKSKDSIKTSNSNSTSYSQNPSEVSFHDGIFVSHHNSPSPTHLDSPDDYEQSVSQLPYITQELASDDGWGTPQSSRPVSRKSSGRTPSERSFLGSFLSPRISRSLSEGVNIERHNSDRWKPEFLYKRNLSTQNSKSPLIVENTNTESDDLMFGLSTGNSSSLNQPLLFPLPKNLAPFAVNTNTSNDENKYYENASDVPGNHDNRNSITSDPSVRTYEQSTIDDRENGNETQPLLADTERQHQSLRYRSHHHPFNPHGATISQGTLNSVNVLMGVAILSLPFAISLAGWLFGLGLLTLYCIVGNITAKMLVRSMYLASRISELSAESEIDSGTFENRENAAQELEEDDGVLSEISESTPLHTSKAKFIGSYADIGDAAFGASGRTFIGTLFTFELLAAATATVILLADSLIALFLKSPEPGTFVTLPGVIYGIPLSVIFKLGATILLVPTTFPRSPKFLSYFSLLGITTIVFVIAILFGNGLSTFEAPGSLFDPAETSILPPKYKTLPLAVGLLIVGVDAHAVFPSLYNDMKDKRQFRTVLNYTYVILFLVYASVGAAGYRMFGNDTMPEITQNLAYTEKYNQFWTRLTLWLVAINPATKYALILNPVNHNFETLLNQYFPNVFANPHTTENTPLPNIMVRITSGFLVFVISVVFPGFHRVLALIGAACSSIIAVMFPVACYVVLEKKYKTRLSMFGVSEEGDEKQVGWVICGFVFLVGAVTAVVGTFGVFAPIH
ncbi:hypothetical protein HK098_003469 [Nowakowskiella sp. JEL0407]|nr:hypothetical protein HK098_003469 [Nowakowskiella sp. JEL0407]